MTTPEPHPPPTAPRGDAGTAVRLERVTRTFHVGEPVHAVRDLTLDIPRGSFTAIMGPSGSGKSTLMNLIGLLDSPTEGTIGIGGRDATRMTDAERTELRGREIGFVFQSFNLMPKLSALDNVALPMAFQNVPQRARLERAKELLSVMGLADRLHNRPNELSGGQRQRVAIARALANDPTLLLADEPTGNLDSRTSADILGLFDDLHARGHTLVLVTHEHDVAQRAERILHFADGRLRDIEERKGVRT